MQTGTTQLFPILIKLIILLICLPQRKEVIFLYLYILFRSYNDIDSFSNTIFVFKQWTNKPHEYMHTKHQRLTNHVITPIQISTALFFCVPLRSISYLALCKLPAFLQLLLNTSLLVTFYWMLAMSHTHKLIMFW